MAKAYTSVLKAITEWLDLQQNTYNKGKTIRTEDSSIFSYTTKIIEADFPSKTFQEIPGKHSATTKRHINITRRELLSRGFKELPQ